MGDTSSNTVFRATPIGADFVRSLIDRVSQPTRRYAQGMFMARILVVDDHPLIAQAITSVCEEVLPDIKVLRSSTLLQALAICRESPDLVLAVLDLELPDCRQFEGVQLLRQEFPNLRIIVYTGREDDVVRQRCLKAGVADFVEKSANRHRLMQAIESQLRASRPREADVATEPDSSGKLTLRQREVLGLAIRGMKAREIADELHLGESTVKTHLKTLYQVAQCRNRIELLQWAQKAGLVPNSA